MSTTLHIGEAGRSALPWQSIVWQGLHLSIPSDWEMLQFSRNTEQGRCAFADRHQFRLELNWRRVAGPPDFERMLSDYSAKLEKDGMPAGKRLTHKTWQGLEGTTPEQSLVSRWGLFLDGSKRLLELVFIWPDEKDADQEKHILDSVTDSSNNGSQRWCAFGMDLRVADHLMATECDVRPAHAEWVFHDKKHREEIRIARRGLVSEWLKQPVSEWLKDTVARHETTVNRVQLAETITEGRHTIATLTGTRRASMLPPRTTNITASAWICPHDGRLYSVIAKRISTRSVGSDISDRSAEDSSHLSCCPEYSS